MPSKEAPLPIKVARIFSNKHWQACYVSWLRSLYFSRSRSRETIYFYQRILVRFFAVRSRNPATYTRQEVERFLDAQKDDGTPVAPATRNFRRKALASFYAYAQQYHISYRGKMQPLLHVVAPTAGIANTRPGEIDRDIDDEEVKRLFAVIPRDTIIGLRDRALMLCYISTSRRRREINLLLWKDIQPATFSDGRQGYLYTFRQKGHIQSQQAELPLVAYEAIKAYLVADGRWDTMRPESPVFCGRSRRKQMNHNSVSNLFKRYARRAGLPETVCLHSLRYYAAWELHEFNGHDIAAVAEHLGHESIDTTMHYIKRRKKRKEGNPTVARLSQRYSSY